MQDALGAVGNARGGFKGKRHNRANRNQEHHKSVNDGQNPKQHADNGQKLLEPNHRPTVLNRARFDLLVKIPSVALQLKKIHSGICLTVIHKPKVWNGGIYQ